jgi:hypothetical protein
MRKLLTALTLFLAIASVFQTVSASEAPKDVPAYLIGPKMSSEEVSTKLSAAGFEVIGTYLVNKRKKLETVVFTNDALKKMASKEGRGFAAIGRILVDGTNKQISVSNPVYFGKAFLQDDADYSALAAVKQTLTSTFSDLKPSSDKWEYEELSDYHFMVGMPYYQDTDVVGEGKTAELLKKAESYKKGKLHLFTLKIAEGKYLVGYNLSKRTAKFTEKIGIDKAGVLPYTILIENDEAHALAAKFYLAVSYPQLTMGEFMKIATVPGAIEKELSKPFK